MNNSFAAQHPELICEWSEKNLPLTPDRISYGSYLLSAYALVLVVTQVVDTVRLARQGMEHIPLLKKIRSIPAGARYLDEPVFRAEVSLYGGVFINLLYVVVNLGSGVYYRSVWFVALSAYYVFLSLIRFLLLRHVRRSPIGREYVSELRRYRLCGGMLLILNLALSAIVTMVVVWNQGFAYGGYLIYVMALFAFYSVILSAIHVNKFRKYHSPVLSAAKIINLTAALVSMLSLETAMFSRFNSKGAAFRRIMTAATGFAVCAFVLGMAFYMIIRASKEIKRRGKKAI